MMKLDLKTQLDSLCVAGQAHILFVFTVPAFVGTLKDVKTKADRMKREGIDDVLIESVVSGMQMSLSEYVQHHGLHVEEANTDDGKYLGKVIWLDDTQVLQHTARAQVVLHNAAYWDVLLQEKDQLMVHYRKGRSHVTVLNQRKMKNEGGQEHHV